MREYAGDEKITRILIQDYADAFARGDIMKLDVLPKHLVIIEEALQLLDARIGKEILDLKKAQLRDPDTPPDPAKIERLILKLGTIRHLEKRINEELR